jgi:hypothetical protein
MPKRPTEKNRSVAFNDAFIFYLLQLYYSTEKKRGPNI